MIDNYFQQEYHSWDRVYEHPDTHHSLFIGDLSSAQNLNFLHAHRISTVVTAALGMDHLDYSGLEVSHIAYPLLDHKNQKISQLFQEFYSIIEKQIKLGSILVHCSAGISRSATLVISYLMRKENWTFKQAITFVRKFRPKVLPNLGFERQLKLYEAQLKDSNSIQLQRKQYCHTSGTRRHLKSMPYEELPHFNFGPVRSMALVNPPPKEPILKRKDIFQVRALKLRSLDSRQKQLRQHRSTGQGQDLTQLNLEVLKVQISSRIPPKKRVHPKLQQRQ